MTTLAPNQRRVRRALIIAIAGLVVLIAGITARVADSQSGVRPEVSGPVLPGWSERAGGAVSIEIIGPAAMFRFERTENGWVMPSRGNYPVRAERLAELDAALAQLTYTAAMTRDPERFAFLGVDDPVEGGAGVRIIVSGANEAILADLVIGRARGEDGLYLRPTGSARAFAATGQMTGLDDPGRWLGLDFMDIDPATIARAFIVPERAPAYILERETPSERNFALSSPRTWQLITAGAANGPATAGARVRLRNADAAPDIARTPDALHRAVTFEGLEYEYRFYNQGADGIWATIRIEARSEEARDAAAQLRPLTDGYWFAVSEDAYERMTRPLNRSAELRPRPVQP